MNEEAFCVLLEITVTDNNSILVCEWCLFEFLPFCCI